MNKTGIGEQARAAWVSQLDKVAGPVLRAAAERELKRRMPIEAAVDRSAYSHLEAVGRTLSGIAPWLAAQGLSGGEARLQAEYRRLAQSAVAAITDPESPDYCRFGGDKPFTQSLVDAAFLAQGAVRAPDVLGTGLPAEVQSNLLEALTATRAIRPVYSNWLLFSAMVEAALVALGEAGDPVRIDYAIREHEAWYLGDGIYGDGPEFHWDYYNSYVIQPMLLEIMDVAGAMYTEPGHACSDLQERFLRRAQRYAEILERLIAPDGTFPAVGRSIAYRSGAFQLLAQLAWRKQLPPSLPPAQIRCALQAVMSRCLDGEANYDGDGWLRIGLSGSQPSLGEPYISTGSLYLCTEIFLPLGLPQEDEFWTGQDADWTSRRLWSGVDMPADHALAEH